MILKYIYLLHALIFFMSSQTFARLEKFSSLFIFYISQSFSISLVHSHISDENVQIVFLKLSYISGHSHISDENLLNFSSFLTSLRTLISLTLPYIFQPEKTANIWWRYHWLPRQMTSEKLAQKFHADDASLPRSGQCF